MTAITERRKEAQYRKAQRMLESIDRKKYWGTGRKINQYRDTVVDNVNLEPLEDALSSMSQESVVSESLIDDLMGRIDFSQLFQTVVVDKLQELVMDSFKEGGSRVLTIDGERLDPFAVSPERIIGQLQQQEIFLKNLSSDAEEKVRDILVKGVEDGKTLGEMQDEIVDGVEGMVEHRAETIARSEIITASARGTEEAMDEAGIDEVEISASIDRQTCDHGSFEWTGPNGNTYTSCKEWDGERFKRENAPTPVKDSHPNCRDVLLAVLD